MLDKSQSKFCTRFGLLLEGSSPNSEYPKPLVIIYFLVIYYVILRISSVCHVSKRKIHSKLVTKHIPNTEEVSTKSSLKITLSTSDSFLLC